MKIGKGWSWHPVKGAEAWACPTCGRTYLRRAKCCEHIDKKHGGKK